MTIVIRLAAVCLAGLAVGCAPGTADCLAIAVCEANEAEVDDCTGADESCHEVTICGSTIYCVDASGDAGPTDGG